MNIYARWVPMGVLLSLAVSILAYLQVLRIDESKKGDEATAWRQAVARAFRFTPTVRVSFAEGEAIAASVGISQGQWVISVRHGAAPKENSAVSPDERVPTIDTLRQMYRYVVVVHDSERNREFNARLEYVDPRPDTDVVLFSIDPKEGMPGEELPFAYLGNSDELKPGDPVCAVGEPLENTSITCGIVGSIDQHVPGLPGFSYIQTDAAINPGNSGGPLIRRPQGDVVGMCTGYMNRRQNLGLCIGINRIKQILSSLGQKAGLPPKSLGVSPW